MLELAKPLTGSGGQSNRKPRRERTYGELEIRRARPKPVRGVSIGLAEGEVGFAEAATHGRSHGMHQGGWALLDPVRLVMRILPADGVGSERRLPGFFLQPSGVMLDGVDQLKDASSILLRGDRFPARKGRELELLMLHEGLWLDRNPLAPCPGLEGPVVPAARERRPLGQGLGAMDPRPVERRSDETFLDALRKDVRKPGHLGLFLVGDDDRLEAPAPELLAPAREAAGLPGEILVEVVHELGELLGVGDGQEKVVVVGEESRGVDRNL